MPAFAGMPGGADAAFGMALLSPARAKVIKKFFGYFF